MKSQTLPLRHPSRPFKHVPFVWLFACALAVCLAPATALAGPALEVESSYSQPDGSTFQASLHGDEYFNYVQTAGGYLVQKSVDDQAWYYVVSAQGGLALGPRVTEATPENALTSSALASDTNKQAYAALGGKAYSDIVHDTGDLLTLADIQAAQEASGTANTRAAQTETSLPLITIVIGFNSGEPDDAPITVNGVTWTAAEQRYRNDYDWNKQLYGGEYSITNFYSTMSNGRFSWVPATAETSAFDVDGNTNQFDKPGDGVIHVTLDRNHGNWKSPDFESKAAADLRGVYVKALEKASNYIDFSAYDANKNGTLEKTEACILFVVAGYEASAGYNDPATWAFQWNLSSMDKDNFEPETIGGITFDEYITMGEVLYAKSAGIERQPMSVGTAAHELGHYLGLTYLYDTYNTAFDPASTLEEYPWLRYDASAVSLMSSGSWNRWTGDDGKLVFAPSSLDAFCLEQLGYIEPMMVTLDGTYDVSSYWSDGGYRCLRIPTSVAGEYFLVENRQYESFDRGLTTIYRVPEDQGQPTFYNATGGIVVWHVDQGVVSERNTAANDASLSNTINTPDHRPGVMPVYLELPAYNDADPLTWRPFYNADALAEFGIDSLSPLLYDGCALPVERIASGLSIDMKASASNVMEVTVDMPEASVASLTPDASVLGRRGGTVEFTVAGQNLYDGVELRVYNQDGTRVADGWATVGSDLSDDPAIRTASVVFPENKGDAAVEYTVRVAYAGVESAVTAKVTVDGRYAQRTVAAEIAGVNIEVAGAFPTDANARAKLSALTDEQVAKLATATGPDGAGALVVGTDVSIVDDASKQIPYVGQLSVTFLVGERLEGKTLWLTHQKADGSLEATKAVARNGRVTMTVNELSPFAVFEQKTAAGGGDAGAAGAPAAVKQLVRTGDEAGDIGTAALALAAAAGGVLAGACALRRRKMHADA